MKTTVIMMLALLLSAASQSQNLVHNSADWFDSDGDGIADEWYHGLLTTGASCDTSGQYAEATYGSCRQAKVGQVLDIVNTGEQSYILSFKVANSAPVWVLLYYNDNNSYPVVSISEAHAEMTQYNMVFTLNGLVCKKIEFCNQSSGSVSNWLKVDEVEMTECLPVGVCEISPVVVPRPDGPMYDLLGRRIPGIPGHGCYVKVVMGRAKTYCKKGGM